MAEDDHSWSPLGFAEEQAVYRGPTQNVRALSEGWAAAHLFCPACGAERLRQLPNNSPVGDFVCDACAEEFELKAKAGGIGRSIPDGAYGAVMRRLSERNNPSLFAMSYDPAARAVTDLIVVPRHFFTADVIRARKPLSPTARRAGWQGCNILIGQVPVSGRIPLITRGAHVPKGEVLDRWRSTLFLKDASLNARGWLLAVMKAVEAVGRPEFTLDEVYAHEAALAALYPATTTCGRRSGSSFRCCVTGGGWSSPSGEGRIGASDSNPRARTKTEQLGWPLPLLALNPVPSVGGRA